MQLKPKYRPGRLEWCALFRVSRMVLHSPVRVLLLESTNMLRKYVGLLDLPFSLASRYVNKSCLQLEQRFFPSNLIIGHSPSNFYSVGTLSDYLQARVSIWRHFLDHNASIFIFIFVESHARPPKPVRVVSKVICVFLPVHVHQHTQRTKAINLRSADWPDTRSISDLTQREKGTSLKAFF